MCFGRSDRTDYALSNACDDCFLCCATNQLFEIRSNGYTCFHPQFDSVPCNCRQEPTAAMLRIWTIDNTWMHRRANSVENIASCQVDGCGSVKIQINARSVGRNNCIDNVHHVAFRKVMCFEPLSTDAVSTIDVQAGLSSHDFRVHNHLRADLTEIHSDQTPHADISTAGLGLQPKAPEIPKHDQTNKASHESGNQQANHQKHLEVDVFKILLSEEDHGILVFRNRVKVVGQLVWIDLL